MKKFIFLILLLLIPSTTLGASYAKYVNDTGSGSGTGAIGDPYLTSAEVNDFLDTLGSGDDATIYYDQGDQWSGDEAIGQNSGAAINFPDCSIVIDDYADGTGDGALPQFDADSMRIVQISDANAVDVTIKHVDIYGASSSYQRCIDIRATSGAIVIDGITGDGRGDGSVTNPVWVVYILDCTGSVEVKNCNLHGFGPATNPTANSTDTLAITIWSADGKSEMSSVSVHDNTIYNINSDMLQIGGFDGTGGSNKAEVYNNTFYNGGENCIDIKSSDYVYIHDNLFYRSAWGAGGSSGPEGLIVLHGSGPFPGNYAHHIYIYNNFFNGNNDGTYDHEGIYDNSDNQGPTHIYNNKFYNVAPAIITAGVDWHVYNNEFLWDKAISLDNSATWMARITKYAKLYNNTFYAVSTAALTRGIVHQSTSGTSEYRNNIVQMATSSAVWPMYIDSSALAPTVNYNNWYSAHTNRVYDQGTEYDSTEQAAWVSAGHTASLFGDPELTDPANGDLNLDNGSNINVDSGVTLNQAYDDALNLATTWSPISVVTSDQDFHGDPPNNWERGCYVYTGAGDPPAPTLTNTTDTPLTCPYGQDPIDVTISFTLDVNGYGRWSTTNQTWDQMTSAKAVDNGNGTQSFSHVITAQACGQTIDVYLAASTESGDNGAESATTHIQVVIGSEESPLPGIGTAIHSDGSGAIGITIYNDGSGAIGVTLH